MDISVLEKPLVDAEFFGMRRLNDLKILYQLQSKIEELRTDDGEPEKPSEAEPKTKEHLQQNSATEHRIAFRLLVSSPVKL